MHTIDPRCRLAALLLGHLRTNLKETIDALLEVASAVFPEDSRQTVDRDIATRHLKDTIEAILEARSIPIDAKMNDPLLPPTQCRVYVPPPSCFFAHLTSLKCSIRRGVSENQSSPSVPHLSLSWLEYQPYHCRSGLRHDGRPIPFFTGENWATSERAELCRRCRWYEQPDARIAQGGWHRVWKREACCSDPQYWVGSPPCFVVEIWSKRCERPTNFDRHLDGLRGGGPGTPHEAIQCPNVSSTEC